MSHQSSPSPEEPSTASPKRARDFRKTSRRQATPEQRQILDAACERTYRSLSETERRRLQTDTGMSRRSIILYMQNRRSRSKRRAEEKESKRDSDQPNGLTGQSSSSLPPALPPIQTEQPMPYIPSVSDDPFLSATSSSVNGYNNTVTGSPAPARGSLSRSSHPIEDSHHHIDVPRPYLSLLADPSTSPDRQAAPNPASASLGGIRRSHPDSEVWYPRHSYPFSHDLSTPSTSFQDVHAEREPSSSHDELGQRSIGHAPSHPPGPDHAPYPDPSRPITPPRRRPYLPSSYHESAYVKAEQQATTPDDMWHSQSRPSHLSGAANPMHYAEEALERERPYCSHRSRR